MRPAYDCLEYWNPWWSPVETQGANGETRVLSGFMPSWVARGTEGDLFYVRSYVGAQMVGEELCASADEADRLFAERSTKMLLDVILDTLERIS